jgi:hypothetical protein
MTIDTRIQALRTIIGQDHFAAENGGLGLYVGVSNKALRSQLNAGVDGAAEALAVAVSGEASDSQLLAILEQHLLQIDRDSLDTEDAEQVAGQFEALLDAVEIESSGGILNTWMYGFDPT